MRKVMKKTIRKKLLAIFAAFTFAILMMFNVNTTINGADISIDGYITLANGTSGGGGTCYAETSCPPDSDFAAVACYGYDFCYASPGQFVDCDFIETWC
jgi:hypothetical protein